MPPRGGAADPSGSEERGGVCGGGVVRTRSSPCGEPLSLVGPAALPAPPRPADPPEAGVSPCWLQAGVILSEAWCGTMRGVKSGLCGGFLVILYEPSINLGATKGNMRRFVASRGAARHEEPPAPPPPGPSGPHRSG